MLQNHSAWPELVARIRTAMRHRLQTQGIPALIEYGALTIDLNPQAGNPRRIAGKPVSYRIWHCKA